MVGSPNPTLSTTLAVLRPTPGRASKASRVRGTSPPYASTKILQVSNKCRALLRYSPMVLICDSKPSSPKASMRWGVGATTNKRRVALFTPTSVACADSKTAANNSNTLVYSNSVLGCGLAALRVAKKGSMDSLFISWIVSHGYPFCRSFEQR